MQECLCPSIWNKGSDRCRFGNNLSKDYGEATLILKKHFNLLPGTDFDVCSSFKDFLFKDKPLDNAEVQLILDKYKDVLSRLEGKDPKFSLLRKFLEKVTPKIVESIQMILKQIQSKNSVNTF